MDPAQLRISPAGKRSPCCDHGRGNIDRIHAINATGVTFLIIEHNMDMVTRLCSRALVMVEGKLLCEGAPRDVTRDQRVIDAYLGAAA